VALRREGVSYERGTPATIHARTARVGPLASFRVLRGEDGFAPTIDDRWNMIQGCIARKKTLTPLKPT